MAFICGKWLRHIYDWDRQQWTPGRGSDSSLLQLKLKFWLELAKLRYTWNASMGLMSKLIVFAMSSVGSGTLCVFCDSLQARNSCTWRPLHPTYDELSFFFPHQVQSWDLCFHFTGSSFPLPFPSFSSQPCHCSFPGSQVSQVGLG